MAGDRERIESFKEMQRMVKENEKLAELTIRMQSRTMLYLHGYRAIHPAIKNPQPDIAVLDDTTFHCASGYAGGREKVTVLNFANAYTPGGGVRCGDMAQEECLCRSSNLYESLTLPYLLKNYYKWNQKNTGDMGSDAVIYSPGVTVFRTDDEIPEDLQDWFQVDVISSAAPYYNADRKKPVSMDKLRQVFTDRIRNILETAAANEADILILGAFGCGAFHNPPDLVAEVFRCLLIDEGYGSYFRKVIFPIPGRPEDSTNLQQFQKALQ